MKKNNVVRLITTLAMTFIILIGTKTFAFYSEDKVENIENKQRMTILNEEAQNGMSKIYQIEKGYNLSDYSRNNSLKTSLINKELMVLNYGHYDLRNDINLKVKNQGDTMQCWAFSVNSALESNIAKTTNRIAPTYSSKYVEYATSKTFLDGTNKDSYNREVGSGGYAEIALGLYTSGKGPVLESDFSSSNDTKRMNLSSISNLKTQLQVKDYVKFDSIYKEYKNGKVLYKGASGNTYTQDQLEEVRNEIKNHIIKYGAITSQTCATGVQNSASKFYNNPSNIMKSTAYFCNDNYAIADHQITIIGWDDNYDVSNFNAKYRPSTNGAYIVLNSWGEYFGENGVYYISYEDTFIERELIGIVSATNIDYDNIYQYDELGNNYTIELSQDVYGANVFARKDSKKAETLTQISISTLDDVKCEVYVNPNSGKLNKNEFVKVASNVILKSGYHTINLEKPIELKGSEFAIIVKYIIDGNNQTSIGLEYPDNYYWKTAKASKGQSYISFDGNSWNDLMDLSATTAIPSNSNLCIKAFTEYSKNSKNTENTKNTDEYFKVSNFHLDGKYIYNVYPNTKVSDFANNIHTNVQYYIYNSKGEIVNQDQIVSTGMTLKVGEKSYKIAVKGDSNGDGTVGITDLVQIRLHILGTDKLNNEAFIAGDINNDGTVSITDLVIINLAILGIASI